MTTADASFFDMIHGLLQEQVEPDVVERRQGERRPFNQVQLLAWYNGVSMPTQADFFQVRCQDLSAEGFSFLVDEPPTHPFVVIALGVVPFLFFVAEIKRMQPHKARTEILVGCQFVRRITDREDA